MTRPFLTVPLISFAAAFSSNPIDVRAADVRVLTAGAYRAVLGTLAPGIEQETGNRLVISTATAGAVVQMIGAGEAVDLAVLPPKAASSLGAALGPATPLAKVGIGVAIAEGAPTPDITTQAGVRAAVLAARAPAWIDPAAGGSSGIYLAALWESWGIAGQLSPKAVLVQGGSVADKVRNGQADIGFQQLSELVGVPGVTVVGPLPASIQSYTIYAGAVPASSHQQSAAAQVLARLHAAPAAVLKAHGLEPP